MLLKDKFPLSTIKTTKTEFLDSNDSIEKISSVNRKLQFLEGLFSPEFSRAISYQRFDAIKWCFCYT